jgi:hypothetical protein
MRLSDFECQTLKANAIMCFGSDTCIRVFGSRIDDQKRGGDVDLLITTQLTDPSEIAKAHIQFLTLIYTQLG